MTYVAWIWIWLWVLLVFGSIEGKITDDEEIKEMLDSLMDMSKDIIAELKSQEFSDITENDIDGKIANAKRQSGGGGGRNGGRNGNNNIDYTFYGDTYDNCFVDVKEDDVTPCTVTQRKNKFRRSDGSCNNFRNRVWGARGTAIHRIINETSYVDNRLTIPRGYPSGSNRRIPTAKQVSTRLFDVETSNAAEGEMSVLFMTFGQFLDHDIVLTPHADSSQCSTDCGTDEAFFYPCIPIKENSTSSTCNRFARSFPVCPEAGVPRKQFNNITSFVDGSNIYGSDASSEERLRSTSRSGELQVMKGNLLPIERAQNESGCSTNGGCSLVGDERGDENVALLSMHTLWVREHNRVARIIKEKRPSWTSDQVYQNTRKIVVGILQHIVYKEWLPKVADLREYNSYNEGVNPSIANGFATAAFRFGHSLVPNEFLQMDNAFKQARSSISLQEAFFNRDYITKHGIEDTMFGLLHGKSSKVDDSFAFGIAEKLFVSTADTSTTVSLLSYNIARGRDHGLPVYQKWKDYCGNKVGRGYNPTIQEAKRRVLNELFGSVSEADLFAAGISESPERNLVVGPTFSCIIKEQFERLRDGDRHYYESRNEFTRRQQDEIKKHSMARVLCDNLVGAKSLQEDPFTAKSNVVRKCTTILDSNFNYETLIPANP